jgi:hypothetical protein
MAGGLPIWAQWVWASISAFTLLGGALWTVFFVYRYMKRMERITLELLRLATENKVEFARGSQELREALTRLADGMNSLGTAQKMAMGVNVVSSLLPMIIAELAGGKNATSSKRPAK